MTYELALKLKNAGFPQKEDNMIFKTHTRNLMFYAPSFSELIEECGDDFAYLENAREDGWVAWSGRKGRRELQSSGWAGMRCGAGPTPVIAVANLWLVLIEREEPAQGGRKMLDDHA